MHEYHLNVLSEEGNKQKLYIVQSGNEIPEKILILAGLLLDQGLYSNEELENALPLGQAYVTVGERSIARIGDTPADTWQFVCYWYSEGQTYESIQRSRNDPLQRIPADIYSHEFARWLTDQYRLVMRKGIELARGRS